MNKWLVRAAAGMAAMMCCIVGGCKSDSGTTSVYAGTGTDNAYWGSGWYYDYPGRFYGYPYFGRGYYGPYGPRWYYYDHDYYRLDAAERARIRARQRHELMLDQARRDALLESRQRHELEGAAPGTKSQIEKGQEARRLEQQIEHQRERQAFDRIQRREEIRAPRGYYGSPREPDALKQGRMRRGLDTRSAIRGRR